MHTDPHLEYVILFFQSSSIYAKASVCYFVIWGADKSLARPTSRCILFDGENISFDDSLVIYIYIYIYIYIQGCIQTFQDSTCKKKFACLGC